MVVGTCISIFTLNMNGLNVPTKRHRLAEWIQKQDPYICCLQETRLRPRDRDTYRLKVRGWKKIFHANGNQKKAGVAIFFLISANFFLMIILFLFIYLFYLWLCWVFVSVQGLSLVVASGGHSSLRCTGLSLSRPLL